MPAVRQDVFPAIVGILPGGGSLAPENVTLIPFTEGLTLINTARIIVTADKVMIATDSGSGPQVVFSQPIQPDSHFKAPSGGESRVVTTSGMVVVYKKDEACGCGSRLRSWSPFRTRGSASIYDPTE